MYAYKLVQAYMYMYACTSTNVCYIGQKNTKSTCEAAASMPAAVAPAAYKDMYVCTDTRMQGKPQGSAVILYSLTYY